MKILETISLVPTNLSRQKPTHLLEGRMELRDNSIYYVLKFYADETSVEDPILREDKDQWEQVFNSFEITALKDKIAGIEKGWCPDSEVWRVTMCIMGFYKDINTYFDNEDIAQKFYDILTDYLFGEPLKQAE